MSQSKNPDEKRWRILQAKLKEEQIKQAFDFFRVEGVEPILIKGWAAARFYPNKYDRLFADIDLCVEPDLFEKAKLLSEKTEIKKLNIDLHCGFRHLDTSSWEDLFDNSLLAEIGEIKSGILSHEDHLRVLCAHWLNDVGAEREKLRDIFYAVKNRPKDFDWNR